MTARSTPSDLQRQLAKKVLRRKLPHAIAEDGYHTLSAKEFDKRFISTGGGFTRARPTAPLPSPVRPSKEVDFKFSSGLRTHPELKNRKRK